MTSPPTASPVIAVLCAGACREILDELGEAYAAASGAKISAEFSTSAAIVPRIADGEIFDLVITTQTAIAELGRAGKVDAGSAAPFALSKLGLAVAAGRPRPEIGTVAAFVAALRGAQSIACADPAMRTPSGLYLKALFDRLELSAELKPKFRLIGAAGGKPVVVCAAVARGDAELGLQQISEIVAVPGVDLVGPLPAEIQETTVFSTAVTTAGRNPAQAREFAAFLASAAAKPVIAAHGMEPS